MRTRLLGIVLAGVAVGCGGAPSATPTQPGDGLVPAIAIRADREYAADLGKLVRDADLIVVGAFTGDAREYARSSDGEYRHLAAAFAVSRVLKGETSSVIDVARTEDAQGRRVFDAGARPLADGAPYLVFLQRTKVGFALIGGPQGTFELTDGRLRSLDPTLPGVRTLDGRMIDEAAEVVASY